MIRLFSRRAATPVSIPAPLSLAGLCLAVACGRVESNEPPEARSPADDGSQPAPDEPAPDEPAPDEPAPDEPGPAPPDLECPDGLEEAPLAEPFELPASTRAQAPDQMIYATEALTGEPLVSEVAVPLALGTEAPSAILMKLGSVFGLDCGEWGGEFSIDSVEILDGDARVEQTEEPSTIAVEVKEAGDTRVEVRGVLRGAGGGTCGEEPLDVPLVYTLLIQAAEFEWSVELTGTCPPTIASGRPLPIRVQARNSTGQVVSPLNIQRPALSLSTSEGILLKARAESFDSLASVVPVGAGTVTVALADGSSAVEMRVLAAEELSGVYWDYWLSGIVSRGDLPLDDGGSYQFVGPEPQLKVRARWVAYEGTWLCGAPETGDYWITSLTPDVCPVESRTCPLDDESFSGSLLYESIPIIANGTCKIRIDAPTFAGGAGASEEFSVDLTNLDL